MRLLHLAAAPQPAPPPRQEPGPALVVQRIMRSFVGLSLVGPAPGRWQAVRSWDSRGQHAVL